jgi:hypothetical protein
MTRLEQGCQGLQAKFGTVLARVRNQFGELESWNRVGRGTIGREEGELGQ